jgi:hypothetical protein
MDFPSTLVISLVHSEDINAMAQIPIYLWLYHRPFITVHLRNIRYGDSVSVSDGIEAKTWFFRDVAG